MTTIVSGGLVAVLRTWACRALSGTARHDAAYRAAMRGNLRRAYDELASLRDRDHSLAPGFWVAPVEQAVKDARPVCRELHDPLRAAAIIESACALSVIYRWRRERWDFDERSKLAGVRRVDTWLANWTDGELLEEPRWREILMGAVNDYAIYLREAGQVARSVGILMRVLAYDPSADRIALCSCRNGAGWPVIGAEGTP